MLKIVDGSGNVVGSYTYDAWGKVLSVTGTIAEINPIRYRSYYYDAETGLYYLQSRYYDPEIGRFISADDTQYLGASGTALGYNLFGYCENNPVNAADPDGYVIISFNEIRRSGVWNSTCTKFGKYTYGRGPSYDTLIARSPVKNHRIIWTRWKTYYQVICALMKILQQSSTSRHQTGKQN